MQRKLLTCNSFVFYGSFYEAISLLPLENQARVYDAIFKFAFENVEVELEGVELAVFLLIKPQLIANRAKYENGCKGGRPRKNETETKPNENLTETETKPNENDNYNVNENKNDISLLKELKERMNNAGAYNGVHDELVNEVLRALSGACDTRSRPRRYNGRIYRYIDFIAIANNLAIDDVCRVVNRLLANADKIDNREHYILSVLASEDRREKCSKNENSLISPSEQIFVKHTDFKKQFVKLLLKEVFYGINLFQGFNFFLFIDGINTGVLFIMENNKNDVANFRQIGLFLGSFSYEKSNKTVHVVEILVWHERTSDTLKTPAIIRIWDCEPIVDVVPFDCVQVNFEYVEGYKGVYKKYLSYEKYEKGVCAK